MAVKRFDTNRTLPRVGHPAKLIKPDGVTKNQEPMGKPGERETISVTLLQW